MAEATLWNTVVTGAWNPAILTPNGVARRLFELPENTPIELEIAVDQPGQFRVTHEGISVVPMAVRLEVSPRVCNEEGLRRACAVARRALASLPETPVSAAGVNIRYQFAALPDVLIDHTKTTLDEVLSDDGKEIRESLTRRALTVGDGVVNMDIRSRQDGSGDLSFNFHRESKVQAELRQWLDRVDEFLLMSDQLAATVGVPNVR